MLKSLLLFFRNSFTTKTQMILENLFLTKQLEIYQRTDPKLKIKRTDRMFFGLMKDLLSNWKERIFIVKPNTIIKWHREGFRFYWKRKSKTNGGRPMINRELIALIKRMANENPLWGAPRIHGELKKLGFDISESTVQRYMPKKGKRTTGQNWKTFLKNHSKEIISIDFLTVPTVNFKMMYVLVMIEHLIRDRDMKYGTLLGGKKNKFGIDEIVTAYRSPWQNGYCERVIGSIKRECLDHMIVLNESHLRNILTDYFSYYNKYRTHLGINRDSPEGRPIQTAGKIDKIPVVNGLYHVYFRQAA